MPVAAKQEFRSRDYDIPPTTPEEALSQMRQILEAPSLQGSRWGMLTRRNQRFILKMARIPNHRFDSYIGGEWESFCATDQDSLIKAAEQLGEIASVMGVL